MRTRGFAREKIKGTGKGQKTLPSKMRVLSQSVRTSGDIERQLNEINIPLINVDDLLEDAGDIENELDVSDDIDVDGEDEGSEDDNVDYDEPVEEELFDIESDNKSWKGIYVAEVMISKGIPSVSFLHVPIADTTDVVISGAIAERNKVFREMAVFLAARQCNFFESSEMGNIVNLNQEDLVKYLNAKGYKLPKEHVSRMIDTLYFMTTDKGKVPSRVLFKRYGHKTGLSKDDKLKIAAEFLNTCRDDVSQLEKAKRFWLYLKDKKGIEIKLPSSSDENNRFRNLKNMIRDAERLRKG